MTTTYEVNTIQVPARERLGQTAHLLIAIRCTECREEHRVRLFEEQLDAVAYLSADFQHAKLNRGAELLANAAREAGKLAPEIVSAFVWQLTHATAHQERALRVKALRDQMAASDVATWGHVGGHCGPCDAEARGEVSDLSCTHVIPRKVTP